MDLFQNSGPQCFQIHTKNSCRPPKGGFYIFIIWQPTKPMALTMGIKCSKCYTKLCYEVGNYYC